MAAAGPLPPGSVRTLYGFKAARQAVVGANTARPPQLPLRGSTSGNPCRAGFDKGTLGAAPIVLKRAAPDLPALRPAGVQRG